MNEKVFISVGTAYTDKQREFVDAVVQWVQAEGLSPQMMMRTVYPDKQPLKVIQETMTQCDGTLVIAFERIFVNDGEEKRGGVGQKALQGQIIPTVWNQIEAAMAYGLNQPILVLVEKGARREGLLEDKFEWLVMPIDVDANIISTREFTETLRKWFKNLEKYKADREAREKKIVEGINPGTLTIAQLIKILRPGQLWRLVCGVAALALAAYTLGHMVGQILGK